MGYNKENYRRIRQAYQTKYLTAYEKADERMREVHAKSPEIAAIDRQLRMTGAEIAMAAIGAGPDYRTRLAAVQEKNQHLQAERAALMTALGYPVDYTLPPYECPKCKDTGFIETKMCSCMHRELVLAAFESSGLGALMQTQSFESFDLSFIVRKRVTVHACSIILILCARMQRALTCRQGGCFFSVQPVLEKHIFPQP